MSAAIIATAPFIPQLSPVDLAAAAYTLALARGQRAARDARLHLERHLAAPDATDEALTDEALFRLEGFAERAVRLAGSPLYRKN